MRVPWRKKTRVFVSYSRHDESLVRPLAGLLGVAADGAVFLDVTSIAPGAQWKSDIEAALHDSSVVVVCWCCEAEKSQFVAYEIRLAMESKKKRLVPVLFCNTPLPEQLEDYQWVDLRGRIAHTCRHDSDRPAVHTPTPSPGAPIAPGVRLLPVLGVAALAAGLTVPLAKLERKAPQPEIQLPSQRKLVVSHPLAVAVAGGAQCRLAPGDIIEAPATPTGHNLAAVTIIHSSGSDCHEDVQATIPAGTLRSMFDLTEAIAEEVSKSLAEDRGSAGAGAQMALLPRNVKLFIADRELQLAGPDGKACRISPGDVLNATSETQVSVLSAKDSDCHPAFQARVSPELLHEMRHSSQEEIDRGMEGLVLVPGRAASWRAGRKGLTIGLLFLTALCGLFAWLLRLARLHPDRIADRARAYFTGLRA